MKVWKNLKDGNHNIKKKVWNKRNSRGRTHDTKYALTYWKHRNPSLQYTASSQRNEKWDSRKCHSLGTYLNMLRRGRRSTCTSSRQPFKKKKTQERTALLSLTKHAVSEYCSLPLPHLQFSRERSKWLHSSAEQCHYSEYPAVPSPFGKRSCQIRQNQNKRWIPVLW